MPTARASPPSIERLILMLRGRRVLLDADLAAVYGVTTKRLNEQVRRNRGRFPEDFAFKLTLEEFQAFRRSLAAKRQHHDFQGVSADWSQFATRYASHRGTSYRPWAFTEHGALMAANVLSSPRALEMSVEVIRAFVRLRELVASHEVLRKRLDELETRYDRQFNIVFDAIRELMEPPEPKRKRPIGFVSGE